jgi:hypothetical protein
MNSLSPYTSSSPLPPASSTWQSIKGAFGYVFRKIIHVPYLLFNLAAKITHLAGERLFRPSPSNHSTKITPLGSEKVVPNSNKVSTEIEMEATSSTSSTSSIAREQMIRVPADGNCLFYSLGIGLRKKYMNYPEIQGKLQWDVNPEQLKGDLSQAKKLLEHPGNRLREQAALYLQQHQHEVNIIGALIDGISSHNEAENRKIINDEKSAFESFKILMDGIEESLKENENNLKTTIQGMENLSQDDDMQKVMTQQLEIFLGNIQDLYKQIQEANNILKIKQDSINSRRDKLVNDNDFQKYIEITKKKDEEEQVFCGIAQLLALSKEYDIPVRIYYPYEPEPYSQIYNEEAHTERQLPILSIHHSGGNHFDVVDD